VQDQAQIVVRLDAAEFERALKQLDDPARDDVAQIRQFLDEACQGVDDLYEVTSSRAEDGALVVKIHPSDFLLELVASLSPAVQP